MEYTPDLKTYLSKLEPLTWIPHTKLKSLGCTKEDIVYLAETTIKYKESRKTYFLVGSLQSKIIEEDDKDLKYFKKSTITLEELTNTISQKLNLSENELINITEEYLLNPFDSQVINISDINNILNELIRYGQSESTHYIEKPKRKKSKNSKLDDEETYKQLKDETELTIDPLSAYFNEISQFKILTEDEEQDLMERIRHGDKEAYDLMVKSNLRLVVKHAGVYKNLGTDLLDLIQDGNIGLLKAIDKFEYERGLKFSTYASWWIRQNIGRGLYDKSRSIRIPINTHAAVYRLQKIKQKLSLELGKEVTTEEIAKRFDLPVKDLEWLFFIGQETVSLDIPVIIDYEKKSLIDLIPSETTEKIEDSILNIIIIEDIKKALGKLSETEKKVLEFRFGLNDNIEHSLKQIGDKKGVSRERIRQIQERALQKLRRNEESNKLKEYHTGLTNYCCKETNYKTKHTKNKPDKISISRLYNTLKEELNPNGQEQPSDRKRRFTKLKNESIQGEKKSKKLLIRPKHLVQRTNQNETQDIKQDETQKIEQDKIQTKPPLEEITTNSKKPKTLASFSLSLNYTLRINL